MKKFFRAVAIATAIASPAIVAIAPSAQAANADVAVITGAGTISPGLTAVPTPQSVSFNGNALTVGTNGVAANYGCSFNGNDLDGSYAEGAGLVSGSCGPISLPLCVFIRVGGVVPVVCAGTGSPLKAAGGVFAFVPNQTPPSAITSYTLAGAAAYADAP